MFKMTKKKSRLGSAALVAFVTASLLINSSVSAVAPTTGKWASRTKVIYASSGAIQWSAGAAKWKNATNFNVTTGGTNTNYYAYTVNDSTVDWDGICSAVIKSGIIQSATLKLNTYFTSQNFYTDAIINGVTGHEVGHSLGLDHTSVVETSSIMHPYTFNSSHVPQRALSPSTSDITVTNSLYPLLSMANNSSSLSSQEADGIYLSPSWAIYYEDEEALTKAADLVVKGTISQKIGSKIKTISDYSTYRSESLLEVTEVLKGDTSTQGDSITVSQMGGSNGLLGVYSDHTTLLNKNQEVLLFLRKTSENTYVPINEDDGVFVINGTGHIKNIANNKILDLDQIK